MDRVRLLIFCALVAACAGSEPVASETGSAVATSPFVASDVTVLAPLTTLDAMTPRDAFLPDDVATKIGMHAFAGRARARDGRLHGRPDVDVRDESA